MVEIETFAMTLQQSIPGIKVTIDPDELRNYSIDGILARMVATPANAKQVALVTALANQQDLTVLARGGGSHIELGDIPERIDMMIETIQLTHLLEHEAPDLTCHVEAGLSLAALQAQLAKKGQWLALDPPDAEQATIGGILATNANGPKRLRYGTARDMVIGLHVVQADGEIGRSGGKVVKNVAGYDLNKLYIGSLGTLGIIIDANFKLQPLPPKERTLLLTYSNATEAMHTVTAILGSLLTPSAIELIDAGAASDMSDFFGLRLPTDGYTLAIDFEGSLANIDRQIDETRLLARKYGALLSDDLTGQDQQQFWQVIREHTRGSVTCKAAILVSQVATYLQELDAICRHHELESAVVAHAGNGILYIELRPVDATSRLVDAIAELRLRARAAHGSLVVERCPVDLKRLISVWGEPGADFYLMQRLKLQFDPKGTFVRGRFVGGL
ncbi:MAG TPA: FAD-binding oxidoreductase [Ktedonobacteraceae bacterium]|jgi:glycolate oxidase FAD binding subunit|nr:FAD-binding oxidoreductase [Ktedonobacteraceae bacterium]